MSGKSEIKNQAQNGKAIDRQFSVAPMMAWTDRHCRFFHRLLTKKALLFTEMVTANAVLYGDQDNLLGFDEAEHPVAFQLGGSDPETLASAAKIVQSFGYDEVNLNVGCPSDRVQNGFFGAALMAKPELVRDCLSAMSDSVDIPVTIKCRIGIDEQDTDTDFQNFIEAILPAQPEAFYIHARKAWLQGLSPKENREIPPLNYDRVYRLKQDFPDQQMIINGGIESLDACRHHVQYVDGVMIGRQAYKAPAILADIDRCLFQPDHALTVSNVKLQHLQMAVQSMKPYIEKELDKGVALKHITRHMLGLFNGFPGARRYRQILTVESHADHADWSVIERGLNAVWQDVDKDIDIDKKMDMSEQTRKGSQQAPAKFEQAHS